MTISDETKAELRRLHAAISNAQSDYDALTSTLTEATMHPWNDAFIKLLQAKSDFDRAIAATGVGLLDALAAAEAERDRLREAAREMLDATFENGCSGHSDVVDQCPICRAHGRLSAALGDAP